MCQWFRCMNRKVFLAMQTQYGFEAFPTSAIFEGIFVAAVHAA